jgi:peptide/nickel transport system permease protein
MLRFLVRRLVVIPAALLFIHTAGFIYALVAQRINARSNPFVAATINPQPLWPTYQEYASLALQGDFGSMPGARGTIPDVLLEASRATLGLLLIAFGISLVLGLLLGLRAVRTRPPGAATWLIPVTTLGLAMPGFFIGIVLAAGLVFYTLRTFRPPPLPFDGFGWDRHLILPVLALSVRPTVQLAQVSSRLLGEELKQQYVIAQRSLGYTWRRIRWRTALRNVLAPIVLTAVGSFRLLLGEIVLIELLFNWPGIGRILALTLMPPELSSGGGSVIFLSPPILSATLVLFTAIFLLADLAGSLLIRAIDPRLRVGEGAAHA